MVSLQLISATSTYPLLPPQVVSICDLQRLALYWFHAPGLQLDNEVSLSTDQPRGTVCHQHYTVIGHVRECLQADTEDAPVLDRPAPLRRFHDSGAGYKYPDLLIYLLTRRGSDPSRPTGVTTGRFFLGGGGGGMSRKCFQLTGYRFPDS